MKVEERFNFLFERQEKDINKLANGLVQYFLALEGLNLSEEYIKSRLDTFKDSYVYKDFACVITSEDVFEEIFKLDLDIKYYEIIRRIIFSDVIENHEDHDEYLHYLAFTWVIFATDQIEAQNSIALLRQPLTEASDSRKPKLDEILSEFNLGGGSCPFPLEEFIRSRSDALRLFYTYESTYIFEMKSLVESSGIDADMTYGRSVALSDEGVNELISLWGIECGFKDRFAADNEEIWVWIRSANGADFSHEFYSIGGNSEQDIAIDSFLNDYNVKTEVDNFYIAKIYYRGKNGRKVFIATSEKPDALFFLFEEIKRVRQKFKNRGLFEKSISYLKCRFGKA